MGSGEVRDRGKAGGPGKGKSDAVTTALMVVALILTIVAIQGLRTARYGGVSSWTIAAVYCACAVVAWTQYVLCRRRDRSPPK